MNQLAEKVAAPRRVLLYSLIGLIGAIFVLSIALWAKYGTTIFFESIRSGLANCFG